MSPLVAPRQAYLVPTAPPSYDSLEYYEFITKTKCIHLDEYQLDKQLVESDNKSPIQQPFAQLSDEHAKDVIAVRCK